MVYTNKLATINDAIAAISDTQSSLLSVENLRLNFSPSFILEKILKSLQNWANCHVNGKFMWVKAHKSIVLDHEIALEPYQIKQCVPFDLQISLESHNIPTKKETTPNGTYYESIISKPCSRIWFKNDIEIGNFVRILSRLISGYSLCPKH